VACGRRCGLGPGRGVAARGISAAWPAGRPSGIDRWLGGAAQGARISAIRLPRAPGFLGVERCGAHLYVRRPAPRNGRLSRVWRLARKLPYQQIWRDGSFLRHLLHEKRDVSRCAMVAKRTRPARIHAAALVAQLAARQCGGDFVSPPLSPRLS
jgi:hypothetical protein